MASITLKCSTRRTGNGQELERGVRLAEVGWRKIPTYLASLQIASGTFALETKLHRVASSPAPGPVLALVLARIFTRQDRDTSTRMYSNHRPYSSPFQPGTSCCGRAPAHGSCRATHRTPLISPYQHHHALITAGVERRRGTRGPCAGVPLCRCPHNPHLDP